MSVSLHVSSAIYSLHDIPKTFPWYVHCCWLTFYLPGHPPCSLLGTHLSLKILASIPHPIRSPAPIPSSSSPHQKKGPSGLRYPQVMSTYHRQMFHSLPMRMPAAASGPGADPMRTRMPPVEAGGAGGAKVVGCFFWVCAKKKPKTCDWLEHGWCDFDILANG